MKQIVEIPSAGGTLHGIVHHPAVARDRRVGVFVLPGLNNKFGAHRVLLDVADGVARAGFYALRYDSRGTCDSPGISVVTFADRIADAGAAVAYFRREYRLNAVLGWGLCMGAAMALHCHTAAARPEERLDGLVLANILSEPSRVSVLEDGGAKIALPTLARNILVHERPARKLWGLITTRENWTRKGPMLLRSYLRRVPPETKGLRAAVSQVRELLARHQGPTLLIFGEKDPILKAFLEKVNPGDRLALFNRNVPAAWAVVRDGDHTFCSREQTAEVLGYTFQWAKPFLSGKLPNPADWPFSELGKRPEIAAEPTMGR